jgi:hypothetical protein
MANGTGWKVAMVLFGLLTTITLGWTASQSAGDKKQDNHITAAEENIRTIHYESQIQRELLESIAAAVGAKTGPIPAVRPLREVK